MTVMSDASGVFRQINIILMNSLFDTKFEICNMNVLVFNFGKGERINEKESL
jgi:hypothetical protein